MPSKIPKYVADLAADIASVQTDLRNLRDSYSNLVKLYDGLGVRCSAIETKLDTHFQNDHHKNSNKRSKAVRGSLYGGIITGIVIIIEIIRGLSGV